MQLERQRQKQTRGTRYTIESFQQKYQLSGQEADRLYEKFGPFSNDLDTLMAAKTAQRLSRSASS